MRMHGAKVDAEQRGTVFDIQRFCTHDGPGIRTTVFFKGCPMACRWCHNPEGHSFQPEVLYHQQLCIHCNTCNQAPCPNGNAREILHHAPRPAFCRTCVACVGLCPTGAIAATGQEMTVGNIIAEVLRDRIFYEESGGGMTLSGGEPLAQPDFCHSLLFAAKSEGINTCVETCGWGDAERYTAIVPLVDKFLWDLKDLNPNSHIVNTGRDLEAVLRNLQVVNAVGAFIRLRYVLVDGVNCTLDRIQHLAAIARTLHNCDGVELLPYHPLGLGKHEQLGMPEDQCRFAAPQRSEIESICATLASTGIAVFAAEAEPQSENQLASRKILAPQPIAAPPLATI